MTFKIDENLPGELGEIFRGAGFEACRVPTTIQLPQPHGWSNA